METNDHASRSINASFAYADYNASVAEYIDILEQYKDEGEEAVAFQLMKKFVEKWNASMRKISVTIVADDKFTIGKSGTLIRESAPKPTDDPLEGFRSFSYNGRKYLLTKGEAKRVQILWERRGQKVLKSALREDANEFKASKVFASDDGRRFMKDFIRNDNAGRYWLEVP